MKRLYLQKQPDNVIQSAVQRARTANHELNKIQQLEKAGLVSTPDDPHIAKVLNKPVPTAPVTQTQYSSILSAGVKTIPAPPDRLWSVEAELASVFHIGDNNNDDPITCMIRAVLDNNKYMKPEDSIVIKMNLNITSPEEYSGSSDLEVYETFVTGVLQWLKMNSLLDTKHAAFQVEYLRTKLKGDALEWYTRTV